MLMTQMGHDLRRRASREGSKLAGSQLELHSAMANLVNNAIRYTPTGGKVVLRWVVLHDGSGEFSVDRHRARYRAGTSAAADRAFLPGRPEPVTRNRGHRPGSGDRQARGATPRCPTAYRQQAGSGFAIRDHVSTPVACARRRQPLRRDAAVQEYLVALARRAPDRRVPLPAGRIGRWHCAWPATPDRRSASGNRIGPIAVPAMKPPWYWNAAIWSRSRSCACRHRAGSTSATRFAATSW